MASTSLTGGDGPNLAANTTVGLTLLRSDLTSVTRNVAFSAGATPGTSVSLGAVAATLTTGVTSSNTAILYTAVTTGTTGNTISLAYVGPGTPNASLSVAVVGQAITVNLATDTGGTPTSTAADVIAAVNGSGPASALVTAAASGFSFGVVAVQTTTLLTGGAAAESYYGLTSATLVTGGTPGDVFTVSQTVERAITL